MPEARRRIAVLDEYLAMPAATEDDIRRLADAIGISRSSFFRLAKVWRDLRDARLLVIGKRGASKRDYGLDATATNIMKAVIAEADPDAPLTGIISEVTRRCAAAGVKAPARQTINNHARKARAASGLVSGPPRIVVGRMWFHLPMSDRPANAMPTLLVAVALPERVIVAHRVSTDPWAPPSVNRLIEDVAACRETGADPRPILLGSDDRRVGTPALTWAGLGTTRPHARSVQRELSKAFNGRLGPLDAIYQRGMARPLTKPVLSRQDQPLPAADVAAIIRGEVDAHNAATVTALPAYDLVAL